MGNRVRCPECGHLNSQYRATCKKCRLSLAGAAAEVAEDRPTEVKARKSWPDWLSLWLAWTLLTTFGWFFSWVLTLGMAFAYGIPDPDAARIIRSQSVWERVSDSLLLGGITGVIPGLVIGLVLWVGLRRNRRDVVWAVVATVVGSALLCAVASGGGPQVESPLVTMLRLGILGGVMGGGFIGVCQWLILRAKVSQVNGWIWLTMAGWTIALTIAIWSAGAVEQISRMMDPGWYLSSTQPVPPNQVMVAAASSVAGAIAGLGQWLLLRRHVKRAGWWIPATALGWGIVAGAGVGVITGAALAWLMHSARRSSHSTAT